MTAPDDPRVRRNHRAEQDAADRPWWRRAPSDIARGVRDGLRWLVDVLGPTALWTITAAVILGALLLWLVGGVR